LQLATVLSELEALELTGDCRSLLPHLPLMPRLTELEVQHDRSHDVPRPYVSGNVLARFPNLQLLCLKCVLAPGPEHWNEHVRSSAVLTNLRALRLHALFFSFWHVSNNQLMPLTV
jgi:hypothetical protein